MNLMMLMMKTREKPYEHAIPITHTLNDAWEFYKNKMIDKDKEYLNRREYKDICYAFLIELSKKIIKESFEYKVPTGLGYLRVKKGKLKFKIKEGKLRPSRKIIDWGNTMKIWKKQYPGRTLMEYKDIKNKPLVMYTNEHTNGEVMRWYWDKRLCHFINQSAYSFTPVKGSQDNSYYEDENNLYYGRLGLGKWINNKERTNEYYL